MSDQMLLYILRAPQSPDDHLAMVQLISRAREAADLLEANAAEIASLKSAFDDRVRIIEMQLKDKERLQAEIARQRQAKENWMDQYQTLRDENEKLRAVYEAAQNMLDDWDNDRTDVGSIDALEQALAAVEQSEAGDWLKGKHLPCAVCGEPNIPDHSCKSKGSSDERMTND